MYCIIHKLSIIYYHYKYYSAHISQPSGTFAVTYANNWNIGTGGPGAALGTDGKLYLVTWSDSINKITVCPSYM
jgi:hypothetical protein